MNRTHEKEMVASAKRILPLLGALMPDLSPEVSAFVQTFLNFFVIENTAVEETYQSILDTVDPIVKNRLHCKWQKTAFARKVSPSLQMSKNGRQKPKIDFHGQRVRPMITQ